VEQAFAFLALPPQEKHSVGLQGLFNEGWQVINESEEGTAQRDVALIIAAQKVEHYEIACYGSLITLAQTLRLTEIAQLFKATLGEEKKTDELLTKIAEAGANKEAAKEPMEM
jgi:ferritin-like metal-binding protein YciE